MSAIPAGQPLSLSLILDEATKHARRHFRAIYLPVAIPVSVASATMPLAQSAFYRGMGIAPRPPDLSVLLSRMGLMFGAFLVFFFVYAIANGALMVAAVDATAGRPVSMRRAWLMVVRPRVLGTMILAWLAAMVGFVLCVLPGVYVTLILCLVLPVIVDEGLAGTGALARSKALMEYNPRRDLGSDPRLRAFLILLAGALLGYVLNFVVEIPAMVVQQVVVMRSVASGQRTDPASLMTSLLWLQVPTSMIAMLAQSVVRLYVSFCISLLFVDVRRRKEGVDLEGAIASLSPQRDAQ